VFNTIFSVIFLKENYTAGDVVALMIICAGATLFMMLAKNTSSKITRDELSEMFYQPTSISFFIVSFIFAKITWTINYRIQYKMK